jgi:hypothetical protein
MDTGLIGPLVVSHAVAILFVIAAWRWPRVIRCVGGVAFLFAGAFNIWVAHTNAIVYVRGFGPHAIPLYRNFIYGDFARHTSAIVDAIAAGQIAVGALAFTPLPWRKLSFIGAIVFLLAITPLGIGAAAPSTLIFAAGFFVLASR